MAHKHKKEQEIQWLLREKYKGQKTKNVEKDIARLNKGEPVDYVIGFVDFLGCKIDVSKKPLIPRAETEYWVGKAIGQMLGKKVFNNHLSKSLRDFGDCSLDRLSSSFDEVYPEGTRKTQDSELCQTVSEGLLKPFLPSHFSRFSYKIHVLDLFSGSGCIGVAVLKHISQSYVDFGEKDKRLLSQIQLNIKKNGIEKKRARVFQTDVFSGIKNKKYNYIFANPPYLAESRKDKIQVSVLKNEPKEALFAGKDGLGIIRLFLGQAKKFLAPMGKIYLEFDSPQKGDIEKFLKEYGYSFWQFYKDQYNKWRFVVLFGDN